MNTYSALLCTKFSYCYANRNNVTHDTNTHQQIHRTRSKQTKNSKQVCERTNYNVYTIYQQQYSCVRILQKVRIRTFYFKNVRLTNVVLHLKIARQSRRQSVRLQSALCEVEFEENSSGLKIAVVKI